MKHQQIPVRLSLVIPCYNESGRVGLLYKGLEDFIAVWKYQFEVLIVNDGSKDNTLELLQQHRVYLNNSDKIIILSQQNTGKGGALRMGVLQAKGDYILTLDADMATSPAELVRWLELQHGFFSDNTIYIGSREHKDSVIRNVEGERKAAGNIFNLIIRTLTPLNARDTQCGFKLYPAKVARQLFSVLKTYGWAHDVELLYHAHLLKMQIKEMPVLWTAIDDSKVKVFRDGLKMLVEVLKIVATTRKNLNAYKNNAEMQLDAVDYEGHKRA